MKVKDKWRNDTMCVLLWNVWRREVLPVCVCVWRTSISLSTGNKDRKKKERNTLTTEEEDDSTHVSGVSPAARSLQMF